VDLRKVPYEEIAGLREERLESFQTQLFPNFHMHLARHAEPFAIRDGEETIGYTLLLFDTHDEHEHVTLIELYLTRDHRDRYEDAVDLIRERYEPRAHLVRTDDCGFETALIAYGFPMEMSMSVMVSRTTADPGPADGLDLVPLDYPHLRLAHDLYSHARGLQETPTIGELEAGMEEDLIWVITQDRHPVGLIIREESEGRRYGLLDILAPHVSDEKQVWALKTAGRQFEKEGLIPAAVVDGRSVRKIAVFRAADYFTAVSYLVFYDPEAGRPHVPVIDRDELKDLIDAEGDLLVLDVMGRDHWERGHLPGSEWIDYRNLSRESRDRVKDKDQPIVVYCNDYT